MILDPKTFFEQLSNMIGELSRQFNNIVKILMRIDEVNNSQSHYIRQLEHRIRALECNSDLEIHTVSYDANNVEIDNRISHVVDKGNYLTTFRPLQDFKIQTVMVRQGESDITDKVFDGVNKINITDITASIVITIKVQ